MSSGTYRIVLLGDYKSGKSSFVQNAINGTVPIYYEPTIGMDVRPCLFKYCKPPSVYKIYQTFLWDMSGDCLEEESVFARCFVNVFFCIIFYRRGENGHLLSWIDLVRKYDKNVYILLCENTYDSVLPPSSSNALSKLHNTVTVEQNNFTNLIDAVGSTIYSLLNGRN